VAGAVTEAEGEAATEASLGETIDIVTPTGGESVTEGTILEWSVKAGDEVKDGDTVVEISTDKVDMELPAPASGTITEILAQEGDTVTVGQVIARMSVGGGSTARSEAVPGEATPDSGASSEGAGAGAGAGVGVAGEGPPSPVDLPDGAHISPVAR